MALPMAQKPKSSSLEENGELLNIQEMMRTLKKDKF